LGQYQVTKQADRVERSVAVAIMADLLLLKLRAKDVPADRPWSVLRLRRAFAWEVGGHGASIRPVRGLGSGFKPAKRRNAIQLPVTFE
jgi:hypothetical protein